ncbi:MAG: glycosyltransferase [Acidimicrobiales bacterium]
MRANSPERIAVLEAAALFGRWRDSSLLDPFSKPFCKGPPDPPGAAPVRAAPLSRYHGANLFVHPSMHESFGTVLIEAMAKGLRSRPPIIPAVRNVVRSGINGRVGRPRRGRDVRGLPDAAGRP